MTVPVMPQEAPLARPIQRLDQNFQDVAAPGAWSRSRLWLWRLAGFGPAFLTTLGLVVAFTDWFAMNGLSGFETALICLIAVTFFWIAMALSTATLGLLRLFGQRSLPEADTPALDVALLVPVYNEAPEDVFGNAAAMMAEVQAAQGDHRFALYVLSDTRDEQIALQEVRSFHALRAAWPGSEIHYRRRDLNTEGKLGNISDWITRWGGRHDAMLVLDADSLMSGRAIATLADRLARDPTAALVQSFPQLYGARTLYGRVQQFSNRIYGAPLAEGLACWTQGEGNYWGHNAIMRTSAFAACAGLPQIGGRAILSHDFVEAGLLRRAGWAVRFVPEIGGSYEEAPPTLIDYVLRDRRWCRGNMQHLRLLSARGLHPVSRYHLFNGAMGYLLSPAWFVLLIVWALIGNGDELNVVQYFSGLNPQVTWPQIDTTHSLAFLGFLYAMLLAPKLMAAGSIGRAGIRLADVGGFWRFTGSVLTEIVLSVLYAPILMVQQTLAVAGSVVGRAMDWKPQQRSGGRYSIRTLLRFHWLETVLGAMLAVGLGLGLVTPWLLPIALSLLLATPLSALSGLDLERRPRLRRQLGTPEYLNAPPIIRLAAEERAHFAKVLAQPVPETIAAE
ncbi:MAG: glucans biosynthesis glucosyltransferase MdoH [Pseudomonadota bacterium]